MQFSWKATQRSRRVFQLLNKFPKFNMFKRFTKLWCILHTTDVNFELFCGIFFNLMRNVMLPFANSFICHDSDKSKNFLLYTTST